MDRVSLVGVAEGFLVIFRGLSGRELPHGREPAAADDEHDGGPTECADLAGRRADFESFPNGVTESGSDFASSGDGLRMVSRGVIMAFFGF